MPVYNKEKYLGKAIESVLNQTHDNLSLSIIDDCSSDSSYSIAKKYKKQDSRISLYKNSKNSGCYYSRNRGLFENLDDDWNFFTIHDSDDTSDPDRINVCLRPFADSNLLGLKTTYTRCDAKGKPELIKGTKNIDTYASEGIAIFRRFVFDELSFFDDTRFAGDTDYWWRLKFFCIRNPRYKAISHLKPMYQALSNQSNLTKIYSDRNAYYTKCHKEIKNMLFSNNFKRDFTFCE